MQVYRTRKELFAAIISVRAQNIHKNTGEDYAHRHSSETVAGEKRVATVPEVVEKLIKLGFKVAVELGAGDRSNCSDDTYLAAGAEIIVALPSCGQHPTSYSGSSFRRFKVELMREGGTLIGFVWPAEIPELMKQLAAKKATVLAIDFLPRQLSRAQKWTP